MLADPAPSSQPRPTLPPLVERTLQRLIRAFAPERVLLFGSRAKGMERASSDIDLLVIAEVEGEPALHQRRAKQLASDCFPRVDVVIATPEEVANAAHAHSPFLLSILNRAVPLYTRSLPGAASDRNCENLR